MGCRVKELRFGLHKCRTPVKTRKFEIHGRKRMINSKQRSYLRSMAHDLDPVAYIGKFTLYRESKENKQIVLPR